jgi:hypothetical protein
LHRRLVGFATIGIAPPADIGADIGFVLFEALLVIATTQVLLARVKLEVALHCVQLVLSWHAIQPAKHGEQDALLRKYAGAQAVQLF